MQIRPRLVLSLSVLFAAGVWLIPGARGESYARVCFTIQDSGSKEAALTENSSPQRGMKLIVHLDASTECTALILPLMKKNSRLVDGSLPQIVLLPQWTEKALPILPSSWDWSKRSDPFELWVFFFKRDAAQLEEIQKLITVMQKATMNVQLLDQQTRTLCKMLASRMSGHIQIVQEPKANTTLIGGTTRRVDFPWRDYAQKVPLNDALDGELVVRHGQ